MSSSSLTEKFEFVFEQCSRLGVPIRPGSRLDRMRQVFLDETGKPIKPISGDSPFMRVALEALRDLSLLECIFTTIDQVKVPAGRLRDLAKDEVLPHGGSRSRGRDLQAELLVATACVRGGMLPVALEDPDVCCSLGGRVWKIAVKRVKKQARIDDNLRDAVRQASMWADPGVVFLDVSQAFDPGDDQVTRAMPRHVFRERLAQALRLGIGWYEGSVRDRAKAKGVGLVYFFFSTLRQDQDSGWELGTACADVDTAIDDDLRCLYAPFRQAFGRGMDRLAER